MLKYIILFCIIHFGNSASRVGRYTGLTLVQQSPITSFFTPTRNTDIGGTEILEYISEHLLIFNAQKWIAQGLWPNDEIERNLTYCESPLGIKPLYNPDNMNEDFKELLKTKWPALNANETEEDLWKREYDVYGSCVSYYTFIYFNTAVLLLDAHNIGNILARNEIKPGGRYDLDRILTNLGNHLKRRFHLTCLQPQNARDQYLLEVQLCFDEFFHLADCQFSVVHNCNENKTVTYPGMPINA